MSSQTNVMMNYIPISSPISALGRRGSSVQSRKFRSFGHVTSQSGRKPSDFAAVCTVPLTMQRSPGTWRTQRWRYFPHTKLHRTYFLHHTTLLFPPKVWYFKALQDTSCLTNHSTQISLSHSALVASRKVSHLHFKHWGPRQDVVREREWD